MVKPQSARQTLAILAFHKIGQPGNGQYPTWNYIPEVTFVGHLNYLRVNGWQVINLGTFLRGLSEPHTLPERSALLTFDDGYRSMLTVALPLLRRFQYPAVLFVPTGFIGRSNAFDKGIEPEEAMCNWNDLQQLERHGVSVQSHGVTHSHFSRLNLVKLREELAWSKAQLEKGLGKHVDVIAYPYGDAGRDPRALSQLVRGAGYRAACLYKGGMNQLPISNPYCLSRVAMGPDTNLHTELAHS